MDILAHRTGAKNAPPNSLAGIKTAYQDGACGIECDITFVDDEPLVWTDDMNQILSPKIKLLTNCSVSEALALKRTDCGEKILRLDDVFDFLETLNVLPAIRIYFDVKYYDSKNHLPAKPLDLQAVLGHLTKIPDRLLDLVIKKIIKPAVAKGLAHRIGFVVFGGGLTILETAKKINPDIATDLIVIFPWVNLQEYLQMAYVDAVTIGWKGVNHWKLFPRNLKRIMEQARAAGRKIRGGVANTKSEVEWLIQHGFDGIWTDDVRIIKTP